MASYVGAIEKFNPYIQQIPTEAFTKVGMYKQQQYEAGVQKVQNTIDKVAGLDIANEGGREYLRKRVDELTNTLNKYGQIDFANVDDVNQLASLAKPLYQDENIVNDVINTGVYRNWAKKAGTAFESGKMELGQYARESQDAATWLSSKVAGAKYTGRSNPNLSMKKDIMDRVVKYKKDAMDKNEFVIDQGYDPNRPYFWKKTNMHYSEAEFNNLIANDILSSADREMLMNESWYENQGRSPESLQMEDINMYEEKITNNTDQIKYLTEKAKLIDGDSKLEYEKTIQELESYNKQLREGKIAYLKGLNLDDPKNIDIFHRDIAENRFISSLGVFLDRTEKQEYVENKQWFQEQIEANKLALKAAGETKTKKTTGEIIDEVSAFSPVSPDASKTEVSLNVIQNGWTMANDEINSSMNDLIGSLRTAGVDVDQFIAGYDQVNIGGKAGAITHVPRFKSNKARDDFYNMFAGLNFAYEKEGDKAHIDQTDFTKWVKQHVAGYNDEDINSKFTLADKQVSDALNTMKGTSALLPKMEKLFSDQSFLAAMGRMDESLSHKKDMANTYRTALLNSGALTTEEVQAVKSMSDNDLMSYNTLLDKEVEEKKNPDSVIAYGTKKQPDGTYAIVQNIYEKNDSAFSFLGNIAGNSTEPSHGKLKETKILGENYKSEVAANKDLANGYINKNGAISKKSFEKAAEYVKKTYSYVQENLNTTVQNLKEDKPAYEAVQSGIQLWMQKSLRSAEPKDILVDGIDDLNEIHGISEVQVLGASVNNTEDIFNPNPVYEITFKYEDDDGKPHAGTGRVSMKSFLAANPNYNTSAYAKYFAPLMYAKDDAYAKLKASINPLEGSENSYANRSNIEPVYTRTEQTGKTGLAYDDPSVANNASPNKVGNEIQWKTVPVKKGNQTTMVSYKVFSLGQEGGGGRGSDKYNNSNNNKGNNKGNDFQRGAYYIQMKVPGSDGKPHVITLKRPDGSPISFNSPSYALYTFKDLILNNPDISMEEIDQKTNQPNYLTTDPGTIRGLFNTQLSYNGYSSLDPVKIVDAFGKEQIKYQASQLQAVN